MLRTLLALCILLVTLAAPFSISAQTEPTLTTTEQTPQQKRQQALDEKKQAFKERVEEKRTAAKEQAETRRETFKEKVAAIQDARKKAVVERLDRKFATVNENRTNRMLEAVIKLSELLDRLQEKVENATQDGKDTTAAQNAIATAQTAITAAEAAITTQAGKEYVATITTEAALRTTVGQTASTLQADLRATHALVVSAKKAVKAAAMEVRKLQTGAQADTPTAPTATL